MTDAINAMGLPIGTYSLGSQSVEVRNNGGFIAGTNTLCGRQDTYYVGKWYIFPVIFHSLKAMVSFSISVLQP